MLVLLGGVVLLADARAALAAPEAATPATTTASAPARQRPSFTWENLPRSDAPGGGLIWRTLASVLVVLVLGGIALYLSRRFSPKFVRPAGRSISVVETIYLGPRKPVHLLKVGTRRYLAGGSRDQVSVLADVTDAFPPEAPPTKGEDSPEK